MKKNKRLITIIFCFLITLFVFVHQNLISDNSIYFLFNYRQAEYVETFDNYSKRRTFEYVSITNDLTPHNYQDLVNIIYTALDRRYESITFYCPLDYKECINDVQDLSGEKNENMLTIVGNLLSPYNNYSNISVMYDTTGKITYSFNYIYDSDMIEYINTYVNEALSQIIHDNMSDREKVIAIHDYLIEYSEYDMNYENEVKITGKGTHPSDNAYGLFKYKLGVCSAYADSMAIMLDKLNIDNFKVASTTHIWNVVNIDGQYLHVDVTWDDPINNIFNEKINDYLLIDTPTLLEKDNEKHNFDKSIYLEIK